MKSMIALFAMCLAPSAFAGMPIPDELKPVCDRLSALSVCMDEPCVCTVENGARDESGTVIDTAQVLRAAHPGGKAAAYHLVIKTGGVWKDYGPIFTEVADPDGSVAKGAIERFWMSYSVEGFGTVLSCDYKADATLVHTDGNVSVQHSRSGLILAFVHQGELRVLEILRHLDEKVSRIDKTIKLDEARHGKEGHRHWKRQVEVLDKGRVRITKRTGNDPAVKKPHQLVGMPVLDILTAFDDEVLVRTPTE